MRISEKITKTIDRLPPWAVFLGCIIAFAMTVDGAKGTIELCNKYILPFLTR